MELLTLQEVARRTSTSVAFWRRQVAQRRIPFVKVGRLVRLMPEAVSNFLAARTRSAVEPAKRSGV